MAAPVYVARAAIEDALVAIAFTGGDLHTLTSVAVAMGLETAFLARLKTLQSDNAFKAPRLVEGVTHS